MLLAVVTIMNIRPQIALSKLGYLSIENSLRYLQPRIELLQGSYGLDSTPIPSSLDLLIHPILLKNDDETIMEGLSTIRESGFDGHIVLAHSKSSIPQISDNRISNYGNVYFLPAGIVGGIEGGNRFVHNGGVLAREISDILEVEYDYRCPIQDLGGNKIPSLGCEILREYTNPRYVPDEWRNKNE